MRSALWVSGVSMSKTSPLDFLNPNTEYVTEEVARNRLSVCEGCDALIPKIKVCKKCGCFMAAKTKLADAECPLKKW